jgi:hypothetical protein
MDSTKALVVTKPLAPLEAQIRARCAQLAEFLVAKNRAYGNSAAEPVRVFSRANPLEQLWVRMDDKLSRLARGQRLEETDETGYDTKRDLAGYLVLEAEVAKLPEWAPVPDASWFDSDVRAMLRDREQSRRLLSDEDFDGDTLFEQVNEVLASLGQKAAALMDLQAKVRELVTEHTARLLVGLNLRTPERKPLGADIFHERRPTAPPHVLFAELASETGESFDAARQRLIERIEADPALHWTRKTIRNYPWDCPPLPKDPPEGSAWIVCNTSAHLRLVGGQWERVLFKDLKLGDFFTANYDGAKFYRALDEAQPGNPSFGGWRVPAFTVAPEDLPADCPIPHRPQVPDAESVDNANA